MQERKHGGGSRALGFDSFSGGGLVTVVLSSLQEEFPLWRPDPAQGHIHFSGQVDVDSKAPFVAIVGLAWFGLTSILKYIKGPRDFIRDTQNYQVQKQDLHTLVDIGLET